LRFRQLLFTGHSVWNPVFGVLAGSAERKK
jgi:hypothetical protein